MMNIITAIHPNDDNEYNDHTDYHDYNGHTDYIN